jgi:hypothetical protein
MKAGLCSNSPIPGDARCITLGSVGTIVCSIFCYEVVPFSQMTYLRTDGAELMITEFN